MARATMLMRDEKARARVLQLIADLNISKGWEITIKPYRKKRSLSQNNLLHSWFDIIAEDTGNRQDDVKEAFRTMFLPQVAIQIGESDVLVGRSTTRLSTEEFTAFLEQVYAFATQELGILLPLPDEIGRDSDGRVIE